MGYRRRSQSSLVVWGKHDLSFDSAEPERYHKGGAPHGLTATHQDQVNADLLAFI
jgi:hypothetical protein